MPAITPAMSRMFVGNVRLVPAPRRASPRADAPPVELRGTDPQALVVGAGLIAAADTVPAATRQDIVDCTLFAQLAATAAAGGTEDVGPWYRAYFGALTALGWAQSDTRFERYEFAGRNAEAHQAVLRVLTALLGPHAAALAIVKAAIDALQSMNENRPWLTLFEQESKTAGSARFQVAAADIEASELLQVALVGFSLKAESQITQVLFFKCGSSAASLEYAAGRATIYEAALAGVRATIATRLTDYRRAMIGEIALPGSPLKLLAPARDARPAPASQGLPPGVPPLSPGSSPARVVRALLS